MSQGNNFLSPNTYFFRHKNGSLHLTGSNHSSLSLNSKPLIMSLKSEEELAVELEDKMIKETMFGSIGLGKI